MLSFAQLGPQLFFIIMFTIILGFVFCGVYYLFLLYHFCTKFYRIGEKDDDGLADVARSSEPEITRTDYAGTNRIPDDSPSDHSLEVYKIK